MQPQPIQEADFVADGELTIVHIPTGTRYTTYVASNPDDFYVICQGSGGSANLRNQAKTILEEMLRRQKAAHVGGRPRENGPFPLTECSNR